MKTALAPYLNALSAPAPLFKLAAAFLVFLNIAILTKAPVGAEQSAMIASFLTINGIVSTILGFLFFSSYFEAAENRAEPARNTAPLIFASAAAAFLAVSALFDLPALVAAVFLPLAALYAGAGWQDAKILYRDSTSGVRLGPEMTRLFWRLCVVALSIATVALLLVLAPEPTTTDHRTTLALAAAAATGVALTLALAGGFAFRMTLYKATLLLGNLFWNMPRVLLQVQESYAVILQLSFLLAIGQGAVMVTNYFYGMLLSREAPRDTWRPLAVSVVLLAALVLAVTSDRPAGLTNLLAIALYALGGVTQTLARAGCAARRGNRFASGIYLVSLAIGFPLVALVTFATGDAVTVVAALCVIQIVRSVLYEVSASSQRHRQ